MRSPSGNTVAIALSSTIFATFRWEDTKACLCGGSTLFHTNRNSIQKDSPRHIELFWEPTKNNYHHDFLWRNDEKGSFCWWLLGRPWSIRGIHSKGTHRLRCPRRRKYLFIDNDGRYSFWTWRRTMVDRKYYIHKDHLTFVLLLPCMHNHRTSLI